MRSWPHLLAAAALVAGAWITLGVGVFIMCDTDTAGGAATGGTLGVAALCLAKSARTIMQRLNF